MIEPKYLAWYQDFQEVALVEDKKGIHIMEFILQTRGQKKYDGYLAVDQSVQAQLSSKKFDMKGCEAMMRKKEIISVTKIDPHPRTGNLPLQSSGFYDAIKGD